MEQLSNIEGKFPVLSIIMYSNKKEGDLRYAELAGFEKTLQGFKLLPGKPLSKEAAIEIGKSLSKQANEDLKPKPGTMIPKEVLYYAGGVNPTIIWTCEEERKTCYFSKDLKIKSKTMLYPKMLFHLQDNSLYVYALKNERVSLLSELYILPLPNIYSDNRVCLGTADVKSSWEYLQDYVDNYEKMFFGSEFNTYHGVEDAYKGISLTQFWNKMAVAKSFDYSVLKRYGKATVKSTLKK